MNNFMDEFFRRKEDGFVFDSYSFLHLILFAFMVIVAILLYKYRRKIKENKEQLSLDISFRNSLKLTRENYVLLRLARKIKAEKDKADQDNQRWFYVGLDVEEYELYMKITEDEETGGNKDGGEV